MNLKSSHKVMLIIADGYGESNSTYGNAIYEAKTPFLDSLTNHPSMLVAAHGEAVGLPANAMGSSEVGHSTIGAARAILQPLLFINQKIADQTFFQQEQLIEAFQRANSTGKNVHFLGMISDGGIHSHLTHLEALLQLATEQGLSKVFIHGIADGRDVEERSLKTYAQSVQTMCTKFGTGKLVDLIGRFDAMDRDQNWERTQVAYELYTSGTGQIFADAEAAIDNYYNNSDQSDYYFPASKLTESKTGIINADDIVVFFNFRSDRAKQLTEALTDPGFKAFPTKFQLPAENFLAFGPYGDFATILFDPMQGITTIGQLISEANLSQLRVAETEKYAHVTYFMNCQRTEPFVNEKRILVPSDKVHSFAEDPSMEAAAVTTQTIKELSEKAYDFVTVNYANLDLVGHSGDYTATVKACEVVDTELNKLVMFALSEGYQIMIVGDHGNAEAMLTTEGKPNPSHTTNPTRLHFLGSDLEKMNLVQEKAPSLANVGATVLKLLKVKPAEEMAEPLIT